jgi:hypothetical protein
MHPTRSLQFNSWLRERFALFAVEGSVGETDQENRMIKFAVVAAAAAGILLAAPAVNTSASAEPMAGVQFAQVTVKVGKDRDWRRRHHHRHCRTVTRWHHGHKTVVRRCD